jgi:hypothetical protein
MYKCFYKTVLVGDAEYVYPWLKPQFLYSLLKLKNLFNNFNQLTYNNSCAETQGDDTVSIGLLTQQEKRSYVSINTTQYI